MVQLLSMAIWLFSISIAITIHEFAHAWAADKLGDPTARISDRLSLNPLKHYDTVGTSLLLFTTFTYVATGVGLPFGWAKPVPFDPYNLQDPRRDSALIALAGPVSNFIVATIASILLRFAGIDQIILNTILYSLITLNVTLAVFNLVPIHPLDGGKILAGILPKNLAIEFDTIMHRYGMFILILLIFPFGGTSAIGAIIGPVAQFFLSIFLP